jgi:uncharacterized membrane protein YbhN (UPF0104 family)
MSRGLRVGLLAVLFLATLAATAWLIGKLPGGVGPILALAARIAPRDWLLLGVATALFYFLDYVRFASLLSLLGLRIGPLAGLELTSVSYFVSTLTPTADLHLPAMVFLLVRRGLPAARAAAASLTKSIYQVTWICVIALTALGVSGEGGPRLPAAAQATLWAAAVPLIIILVIFAVLIAIPERVARVAAARRGRLWDGLADTARTLATLGRSGDRMHLVCHAGSIAFVFVYIAIGWWLARALGIDLGFARAIPIFAASLMVAYLAPVPGSIGVTEVVTSYLIDPGLSPAALATAILLRVLCWYLVIAPGALLLLRAAWQAAHRRPTP